jgi:polyhydroxyalkanoate synthesis regulator phasin
MKKKIKKKKMRLKDIFLKVGKILPYIGIIIALENRNLAREAKLARLEKAKECNDKLLSEIQSKHEMIVANEKIQTKIVHQTADVSDNISSVTQCNDLIKELVNRLKDPNISPQEFEFISGALNQRIDEQAELIEKANTKLQNLIDSLVSNGNGFIDWSNITINKYKDYLSILDIEQINGLINILGLIVISSCFISIIIILYNDYLIKIFNLEVKYPRINRFLQLRRNFQRYYLNLNITAIFITLIFLFGFNIDCLIN